MRMTVENFYRKYDEPFLSDGKKIEIPPRQGERIILLKKVYKVVQVTIDYDDDWVYVIVKEN